MEILFLVATSSGAEVSNLQAIFASSWRNRFKGGLGWGHSRGQEGGQAL